MAVPTTRTEFKEYCLRKLGNDVLQINVSDAQVEDRIDEALKYYADYHFAGSQQTYLKHQLTATDITNGYIPVPEEIIGGIKLFALNSSLSTGTGMFNVQYQYVLNNIQDLTSGNLVNFWTTMEHIQFLQDQLVAQPRVRYNRHVNRLFIDMELSELSEGTFIIAEAAMAIDPETYADVWSDRWLQNYATAKIKYQWGNNTSKFTGMQLPGGVQFNGELILQEAKEEIRQMEEEMIMSFSLPVYDMIG